MFHELPRADSHKIRLLFTDLPFSLVMDAVIAGNTPARLWANDVTRPASVFMWDKRHGYYLAGDPSNSPFNLAAQQWVAEQVEHGPFYAKIHYSPAAWETVVPQIFSSVSVVRAERVVFALKEIKRGDWAERIPTGFRMASIDEPLLSRNQVTNLQLVREEISGCWSSLTRFLAEGFGFCLIQESGSESAEEIVCWCTAEYVSNQKLGISIETLPTHQGCGFATLTAAAFVHHCRERSLTPYWDAFQSNAPSLAVAEKVGFERAADYAVFLGRDQ